MRQVINKTTALRQPIRPGVRGVARYNDILGTFPCTSAQAHLASVKISIFTGGNRFRGQCAALLKARERSKI